MIAGNDLNHAADVTHGVEPLHLRTHHLLRIPCTRLSWRPDHSPLDVPVQFFPRTIQG